VTIQLLSINDFHGNVETPASGNTQYPRGIGGAEYLSAHITRAEAENPNSIVVGAGDLIGASPMMSALFHDEPAVLALNDMRMAVSSVGNHEFDKGTDELLRMQRGGCSPVDGCRGAASFPGAAYEYLAANVVRKTAAGSDTLFPPTAIRTVGGVKIGFIGEVLKDTPTLVQPSGIRDLTFLDEASTANKYVAELQRQGVRAIVLLIHQGGVQGTQETGDPNACENFRGGILPILDKLSPDIKMVVAGHSHSASVCHIGGRTVINSGAYGRGLSRIDLTIDRATDEIVNVSARNESVTHDVPADAAVTRIIDTYRPLGVPIANRVIGRLAQDITKDDNGAGESALGDDIADGELEAARAPGIGGADVAFMNPGGIRVNLTMDHPGQTGARGEVTYGGLYTVQPFSNMLYTGTISGKGLKDLLEQQFHGAGRTILQVSNGFTYRYRKEAPDGQHVVEGSMRLNGTTVQPEAAVRLVASDFLFYGGDGFSVLTDQARMEGHVSGDLDAFVAYFERHSPVGAGPQNRITALP
jgi:5'-nucleotidase